MKIGFDARLINESGVGRYIRNLLPLLIKNSNKNYNWILLIRTKEKEDLEYLLQDYKSSNIKIVEVNARWHSFKEQIVVPWILYRENLDVFHVPYMNIPIFYFKRLIVTIHDLTVLTYKTGKATTLNPIFYFIKRVGYRLALFKALRSENIVTVSHCVRDEILDKFKVDPSKIRVAYNGYSKLKGKRTDKLNNFFKGNNNYFFYIGNCHSHKNLYFLVDTLDKFFNKFPTYKMVFAGKEDYFMDELQDYIKNKENSDNFVFYKSPTDGELYYLYKNSLLVILPSIKEGFGMQLLECMQMKKMMVLSRISAYQEVAGDTGFYFDPNSKRSLILALNKALKTTRVDRNKLYKKYKVQLKKFDWEETASELLNIYESKERKEKKLISKVTDRPKN